MWLKKYKSDSAVITKIKMLKTFNSLGLNILAPGYSSHFFIIGSENFDEASATFYLKENA